MSCETYSYVVSSILIFYLPPPIAGQAAKTERREGAQVKYLIIRLKSEFYSSRLRVLAVKKALTQWTLTYNHQLRIIQHDLLFTIHIKFNGGNRIVIRTFHFCDFTKTKFLVLYSHACFQFTDITGNEIG